MWPPRRIPWDFIIDGESIGDVFYAFDMLEGDKDYRHLPYRARHDVLCAMRGLWSNGVIRKVETAWVPGTKRTMLASFKERRAEGAVFKD